MNRKYSFSESILSTIPEQKLPIDAVLGSLDEPKSDDFLQFICKKLGVRIKSRLRWSIVLQKSFPRIYNVTGFPKATGKRQINLIHQLLEQN